MKVDLARVRELVELVSQSQVAEVTVRGPELSITVRKKPIAPAAPQNATGNGAATEAEIAASNGGSVEETRLPAKSPAVGFAHLRSKERGESMVRPGDVVTEGQIVCVIESMNVPIEVHAPCAGRVMSIEVQEGQPVEYGQPVIWIERTRGEAHQ